MENNQQQNRSGLENYIPAKFNIDVFFSPRSLGTQTSLSVNYTRGALTFDFTKREPDGNLVKISRKVPYSHLFGLSAMYKKLIGTRVNLAQASLDASGKIEYPSINVEENTYSSVYFDKNATQYVDNGTIQFSTVLIDEIERMAITATDNRGASITVVLFDESIKQCFAKVSLLGVMDSKDIPAYYFGLLIEKSCNPNTILTYAIGDKILQALYRQFPTINPNKNGQDGGNGFQRKSSFFDNFKRKDITYERTAEVKNESPDEEDGADLFDE